MYSGPDSESETNSLKEAGAGVDGTHLRSTFLLEQKLQCKLNQSWGIELAGYKAKARVVSLHQGRIVAAGGVRRSKLDAVKSVEKFGSKLKPKPVIRTKICRFI
jgi:hypothetical protein